MKNRNSENENVIAPIIAYFSLKFAQNWTAKHTVKKLKNFFWGVCFFIEFCLYDVGLNFHKTLEPKSGEAEFCHKMLLDFPKSFES